MELKRALLLALCTCAVTAAHAGDYVLEIDGQKVEIDLDRPASANVGDKKAKIVLHQKTEQTWREEGISFVHPAAFAPSRRNLDKNITQTIMTTPSGTIVLVQHYIGTDPTPLVDMMVGKLSDDEVTAGYKREIKYAARQLADGTMLSGKSVRTEHPGDTWEREVLASGDHDAGFLIVAAVNDSSTDADRAMMEKFWRTLRLAKPGALEPLE